MANFGALKTRVSKRVGLDTTASGNDDVLLGEYLNDAVREFLIKTKVHIDRGEISITSETDDSELSTNVLQVSNIYITGSDTRKVVPERVTADEIIYHRTIAPTTGITTRLYCLQGDNLFMFYPALAAGTTVTVYFVPKPSEMSSGAHDPSDPAFGGIPVQYHPVLEEYATWRMMEYDDSPQRVQQQEQRYLRMLVEARRAIRGQGGESLGRIRVGERRAYPFTESTDRGW